MNYQSVEVPGVLTPDSKSVSLSSLWQNACESGYSAALWRLPHQTNKELIIDTSGTVSDIAVELEELPAGFAVSPFLNPEGEQTLFLKADLYWQFDEKETLVAEERRLPIDHPSVRKLVRTTPSEASEKPLGVAATAVSSSEEEREQFEESVRRAVRQMERGTFRKVVLSRTKEVGFDEMPDVIALFKRLCAAYPTAFVSAVFLPDRQQIWIGATPERLVSVDHEGLFRTVALAGTQSAYDSEGRLKRTAEAQWTQKEIEEQALVCRYIIGCFKKIRLREYLEEGPKTVVAGNLMHLRSDFTVDTHAVNFPQLGTVMLRLLHPTSAVCGMPREAAQKFIFGEEKHQRELYSGFLGPVNIRQETHLFVNLRCLKLEGRQGTLYAGAGITEDSVPAREWRETELKCRTLLDLL